MVRLFLCKFDPFPTLSFLQFNFLKIIHAFILYPLMSFIPYVGAWYTKQDHKKKMGFNATSIACIHACVASSSAIRFVRIFQVLIFVEFFQL